MLRNLGYYEIFVNSFSVAFVMFTCSTKCYSGTLFEKSGAA